MESYFEQVEKILSKYPISWQRTTMKIKKI